MSQPQYKTWISTPIMSNLGGILHAGSLQNTRSIDPKSMRILGEFALVLILSGTAYDKAANGTK